MKAKKILLAAAVLAAPQFLSAQMVLNQRGQTQFGPYIDADADKVPVSLRDTITSLSVFGNGSSGINGRISFGDHATLTRKCFIHTSIGQSSADSAKFLC